MCTLQKQRQDTRRCSERTPVVTAPHRQISTHYHHQTHTHTHHLTLAHIFSSEIKLVVFLKNYFRHFVLPFVSFFKPFISLFSRSATIVRDQQNDFLTIEIRCANIIVARAVVGDCRVLYSIHTLVISVDIPLQLRALPPRDY